MRQSVGIYTLGCKVSQYESEAIAELFMQAGFEIRPFFEKNDAYVINTCTVTAESDRKSRQYIRRAITKNPDAVVAVIGCYSQRSPGEVGAIDGVDIIIGTDGKCQVVRMVTELLGKKRAAEPYQKIVSVTDVESCGFEYMRVSGAPRTRAYVKIEDGCECRCTYCAISDARGRVRSKLPSDVLGEVGDLFSSGIGEVVLTGIETGSYGKDFGTGYGLANLITDIDKLCPNGKIRLGSLAPELVDKSFIEKVSKTGVLLPHFHLSMQSGSDRVLARMKRRYNREMALKNVEIIKEAYPRANFTTDLMVGFPGESEEDFLLTCDFVSRVGFLDAHVFSYSKRKNTPAASYQDQIEESEKARRSERLIIHKNRVRDTVLEKVCVSSQPLVAIAESLGKDGFISAHSESFIEIKFSFPSGIGDPSSLIGKWIMLKPLYHKDGILYCENINFVNNN